MYVIQIMFVQDWSVVTFRIRIRFIKQPKGPKGLLHCITATILYVCIYSYTHSTLKCTLQKLLLIFCSNLSERLSGRQTNNHAEIYVSKQEKYFHVYILAIVTHIYRYSFCFVERCSVHAKNLPTLTVKSFGLN